MSHTSQMFVRTRYLGPTDHRGARIKATNLTSGRSVTIAWDHELDAGPNHEAAARALYTKLREHTGQAAPSRFFACDTQTSDGYYFTACERNA